MIFVLKEKHGIYKSGCNLCNINNCALQNRYVDIANLDHMKRIYFEPIKIVGGISLPQF